MARYFEQINDNFNVVVDDQFNTAKFLIKSDITAGNVVNTSGIYIDGGTFTYYGKANVLAEGDSLRDLGFDYDDADVNLAASRLMLFVRTDTNYPYRVNANLNRNATTGKMTLSVLATSDLANCPMTICLYTTAKMLPSKLGLLVYNEQQELVFDALKGHLQNVGILNGGVSVGNAVAATYDINVPIGLTSDNLFISMRSALPFYAAYRISSGGVSYSYTYYYPVMTFPTSTTLRVQLVQQRSVAGNNSSTRINNYFENVIYCPYPKKIYTGFGN